MRSIFLALLAALPIIDAAVSSPRISKTGRCGSSFGLTCSGSSFGNCCSKYNYCGKTSAHCDSGCQSGFGKCNTSPVPISASAKVSKDGSCGGKSGFTCLKSAFGNCCSQYGYCGSSNAYCGSGCNPAFGSCSGPAAAPPATTTRSSSTSTRAAAIASSPATKPATHEISTNARCGNAYQASPLGMTCAGSKWGNCCSKYSYCGSTDAYCGSGCQPGFGNCKPASSSAPSASSSPAKAAIAPASAPPAMRTHAGSLSTSSSSTVSSSTTSSQATSASLADPVSSSSSTNPSIESLYLSMSATSASASTTAMESSYSPEAASESTADPEIVPGPGESPASLALSEVTALTDAIISSSSVLATLAESPTITAEPSSTAAAPLATSEVASSQVEIVSSVASTTELVTSVEPTTTLMPKSTESQIVPMETETETISSTVAPVISVSPSSESVASSEATPTPVEETLSSSVVVTPSPLPEVPTSSSPVSSIVVTSTTSAPVTCNTLAASYNPSFESGAIAPWTNTYATNTLYGKTEVLSVDTAPFAPLDGSHALYTTLTNRYTGAQVWRFTLDNVYIPAGSNYNCTVGFKIVQADNRPRYTVQARLYIDNQLVYHPQNGASNGLFTGSPTSPEAAVWNTVGGSGVANTQDQHTVLVLVLFNNANILAAGTTFAIDNLQCFPTGQCVM